MKKSIYLASWLIFTPLLSNADCDVSLLNVKVVNKKIENIIRSSRGATDGIPIKILVKLSDDVTDENFVKTVGPQLAAQNLSRDDLTDFQYFPLLNAIEVTTPICSIIKFSRIFVVTNIEYNGVYSADPSVRVSQ